MPALTVLLDGALVATVSTDGYDVLTVDVGGTLVDSELATLNFSGGSYPKDGKSTYLVWAPNLPIAHGQVVTVAFLENAPTSQAGKTIDELFPDEEPVTQTDFTLTADMLADIRAREKIRDTFNFRLEVPPRSPAFDATSYEDHGLAFSVIWDSSRPEQARMSLHSYTLDGLEARAPGNYFAKEVLHYGDSVQFELLPLKTT